MNPSELLHKNEVFNIVGAAMDVLNGIAHGLHENPMRTDWSSSSSCAKFLATSSAGFL